MAPVQPRLINSFAPDSESLCIHLQAKFPCYQCAYTRNKVISKSQATPARSSGKVPAMSNALLIAGFFAVAVSSFAAGYGLRSYRSNIRRRRFYWQGRE